VDANIRLMQKQEKVSRVSISGLQSMETLKASGWNQISSPLAVTYAQATNARQEMDVATRGLAVLPSPRSRPCYFGRGRSASDGWGA